MKRNAITFLLLVAVSTTAWAQAAGDTIVSIGGAWLDFANSSSTDLQSVSQFGTFSSPNTSAQIHNALTAEVIITHFLTNSIAIETAMGWPPTLKAYAQGDATPLGSAGPQLPLGTLRPLISTRAWPVNVFLKYYFADARSHIRPYVGVGANYTWYTNIALNPTFYQAAQSFSGAGGTVRTSLSPSWNPVFAAGLSYEISNHWYATGSVSYVPLRTSLAVSSVTSGGAASLTNTSRITADPVILLLGIGYRF